MRSRLVLLGLCCVTACSGIAYEGRYDYALGWRSAVVERTSVSEMEALGASLDCRTPSPAPAQAYLRYEEQMRPRHAAISWPDAAIHEGQRIYINVRDCRTAAGPSP